MLSHSVGIATITMETTGQEQGKRREKKTKGCVSYFSVLGIKTPQPRQLAGKKENSFGLMVPKR